MWAVYRDPRGPLTVTLTFGPAVPRGTPAEKVQTHMAVFDLPPTHEVTATLKITNDAGQPARIDGLPVWTVSDPAIVTLDVATDGMSAIAKATGTEGVTQVTAEVDADRGEGVRPITAIGDIAVLGPEASVVEMTFGTSVPQAVPPQAGRR
jgi:hypothetical protein